MMLNQCPFKFQAINTIMRLTHPYGLISHILELSSKYGVAFEGFIEETHSTYRLIERKVAMEEKGKEKQFQHLDAEG